jgi:hypothetical protein
MQQESALVLLGAFGSDGGPLPEDDQDHQGRTAALRRAKQNPRTPSSTCCRAWPATTIAALLRCWTRRSSSTGDLSIDRAAGLFAPLPLLSRPAPFRSTVARGCFSTWCAWCLLVWLVVRAVSKSSKFRHRETPNAATVIPGYPCCLRFL